MIDIPTDEPTFVEERTHHDQDQPADTAAPDTPADVALYTRILPFTIAEGTPLEEAPYPERAELLAILAEAHGPLQWTEHVRARMPLPDEATALRVPEGTPILDVVRIATAGNRALFAESERRNPRPDLPTQGHQRHRAGRRAQRPYRLGCMSAS